MGVAAVGGEEEKYLASAREIIQKGGWESFVHLIFEEGGELFIFSLLTQGGGVASFRDVNGNYPSSHSQCPEEMERGWKKFHSAI